jgi:hypothetical protein
MKKSKRSNVSEALRINDCIIAQRRPNNGMQRRSRSESLKGTGEAVRGPADACALDPLAIYEGQIKSVSII